jgi:DNA-binding CsgD family transcriptional regulator
VLEQEQYNKEIETKNRKLFEKVLYLTTKNNLIKSIVSDLEKSNKVKPTKELSEYVKRLKGLLKKDEEWENFENYFDEVNHGLLERLKKKHANLNANDIRFISYLYMSLSLKEIASIMNITPEASRKRKERIRKKINLNENEELYDYIYQI